MTGNPSYRRHNHFLWVFSTDFVQSDNVQWPQSSAAGHSCQIGVFDSVANSEAEANLLPKGVSTAKMVSPSTSGSRTPCGLTTNRSSFALQIHPHTRVARTVVPYLVRRTARPVVHQLTVEGATTSWGSPYLRSVFLNYIFLQSIQNPKVIGLGVHA